MVQGDDGPRIRDLRKTLMAKTIPQLKEMEAELHEYGLLTPGMKHVIRLVIKEKEDENRST